MLALLALVALFSHSVNALTSTILPVGHGPFNTTLKTLELVDKSRMDPYNSTHVRRLMISRFDPVPPAHCGTTKLVQYFPKIVATTEDITLEPASYPTGLLGKLQMQVCSGERVVDDSSDKRKFPLVLFSPGWNTTRLFYSLLAQEVASYGYTVVTIDHPYDTDVVEFPDGTVIYGSITLPEDSDPTVTLGNAVEVRAVDISFVLNELGGGKALVFGHSLGGAASAASLLHDARFLAGVNLDGSMFGSVLTTGFHHPGPGQSFLLFGSGGHNSSLSSPDTSWYTFWETISKESRDEVAWKGELSMKDGFHGTWWDLNVVVDVLGIRDGLSDRGKKAISPVKGERAYQITGAYLSAFFEQVLTGKKQALLEKESTEYPEVKIVH
jgi:pimeloyl-ACP methyl ester carboxylesterase